MTVAFKPIGKMWERIQTSRGDSDASLFWDLLLAGEMLTKIAGATLVAAIRDDPDRHRYRLEHRLVRGELGEWSQAIDELLTGPASTFLRLPARELQRELTQRLGPGSWQYDSVQKLNECLRIVIQTEELPPKVDGKRWFSTFAHLRNKTRGHGATTANSRNQILGPLEESVRLVARNFSAFNLPWAYLHRNYSGKYNVVSLSEDEAQKPFDHLKSARNLIYTNGVYAFLGEPVHVGLIRSDVDALDFFFPNGQFNPKAGRFELISYTTDAKRDGDAAPYLAPPTELPPSDTQGFGELEPDPSGKTFTNLPPVPNAYVRRPGLEKDLLDALHSDRQPIFTLRGMGGIGKTSMALTVLHQVAASGQFQAIVWFSGRDIDLLPEGPKLVRANIVNEEDMAREFVRLMGPEEAKAKGFKPLDYLSKMLHKSDAGPLVFVFDNFETVQSPIELYKWLHNYVRLPNKILITTRFRDFNGDFSIPVDGMNESEANELIDRTALNLGVSRLVTNAFRRELHTEADGHPYVLKVLLGEVAKAGKLIKVERIVAAKDQVLDALFERTFAALSPAARRVFLTLAAWRSTVPLIALEAVLLRPASDRLDVGDAVDELKRYSMIEVHAAVSDETKFVSMPLAASVFGKRKLDTSPMKSAIESDLPLLQAFGAGQLSDVRRGVAARIERMFGFVEERCERDPRELDQYLPMLELIAQRYPRAWLQISTLHEQSRATDGHEKAKNATRRYLETGPTRAEQEAAWERLVILCQRTQDEEGELQAWVELSQLPEISFTKVTSAANRLNVLFMMRKQGIDAKQRMAERVAAVMEARIEEGDADACSRLAWLCRHLREEERAVHWAKKGLEKDPDNWHCRGFLGKKRG